jgi:hypothetical protein
MVMHAESEPDDALGFVVLYGTTDRNRVTYTEAKAALDRHGLSDAPLPQPTRPRAYSRAVAASETPDRYARRVANDVDKKVHRFYRAQQEEGTERVDWPDEDRVVFDKKNETISVEGQHGDKINQDFEHFATHVTGDDIRQMTRAIVEGLDGISLRGSADVPDAGGTYFVPIQHRDQLNALAAVLEELHVGYLRLFVVIRGEAEQLQVALQAEFAVQRQITEIVHAAKALTSRVSAAHAYRRQLDRLAQQLRDYAGLTGREVSAQLQSELQRAYTIVDAKIAELTPKPNAKSSPGRR